MSVATTKTFINITADTADNDLISSNLKTSLACHSNLACHDTLARHSSLANGLTRQRPDVQRNRPSPPPSARAAGFTPATQAAYAPRSGPVRNINQMPCITQVVHFPSSAPYTHPMPASQDFSLRKRVTPLLPIFTAQPHTGIPPPNLYTSHHFNNTHFIPTVLSVCSLLISSFSLANICSTFSDKVARPFITLKVQGESSTWLFDTGAAANCLSLAEFRKIPPDKRPPKIPSLFNLATASADSLKVVGVYNMEFTLQNRTIVSPVFVCSNLNQNAILGMDAIKKFGLIYSPIKERFSFETTHVNSVQHSPTQLATLKTVKTIIVPPLMSIPLTVSALSDNAYRPPAGITGLAYINSTEFPLLNGGPGIVQLNRYSETTIRVNNCSPAEIEIPKHSIIGYLESVLPQTIKEINSDLYVSVIDSI